MATQTYTETLVVMHCSECHVAYGLERSSYDRALNDGGTFYCTSGHSQGFVTTTVDKLRAEVEAERRRRGWAEATSTSLRDQLGATQRSLRGHKAAKTRIKNRISNGVCPCCNRHFANVEAHMRGQHPSWEDES